MPIQIAIDIPANVELTDEQIERLKDFLNPLLSQENIDVSQLGQEELYQLLIKEAVKSIYYLKIIELGPTSAFIPPQRTWESNLLEEPVITNLLVSGEFTPAFMEKSLTPFVSGLTELQHIIDNIRNVPHQKVNINEIRKLSQLTEPVKRAAELRDEEMVEA